MPFFKPQQPILQRKPISREDDDFNAMRPWRFNPYPWLPLCGVYTCIDQSMVLWGLISGLIFLVAQFCPFSWVDQAIAWSILTIIGTGIMVALTYGWTVMERLSWLLYTWVGLMVLGMVMTDVAIALGWGWLLGHLCSFWLLISAVGYLITGFAVRSRAFFLATAIHGGAVLFLPYVMGWQFLFTGLIMMSNLLIFAEGHWDMILPKERFILVKKKSQGLNIDSKLILDN
ncbi:hypothetical protein IQ215_09760 [Cyanobacterium stanieri LEGE 03274]|uniref:DUF2157 domain-containing protein n=1 Tax=Cyanobacterium stanieri LEGE 03274 TaxID=1828756 RepID=A0ABR9V826_9CHRO|nr:hypothetical protein [Cyanobacterium stanieri]MBE9222979.1 hypothetical protein [Cyanobacterium stanieri LEGE 03274]